MGPIALFDKSFLQSLTVDESVWFDHFFLCNTCPIFFAETLADLHKKPFGNHSPEREVSIIASKFPEMHGVVSAHHSSICANDLLGYPVPMNGQIILPGAKVVSKGSKKAAFFEQSPEQIALQRWQNEEFEALDRDFASAWREQLKQPMPPEFLSSLRGNTNIRNAYKSLADAKALADKLISATENTFGSLKTVLSVLGVSQKLLDPIMVRWSNCPAQPFSLFAPYAAFVMSLNIFYLLSVAKDLISGTRTSNRTDLAYLFYLPFCNVFISSDNLHRRCARHYLRQDQDFVWGLDLKQELARINKQYSGLSEVEKERGVITFARQPRFAEGSIMAGLYDRHMADWRSISKQPASEATEESRSFVAEFREMQEIAENQSIDFGVNDSDVQMISVARKVKRKKGSWYQVPKDYRQDSIRS